MALGAAPAHDIRNGRHAHFAGHRAAVSTTPQRLYIVIMMTTLAETDADDGDLELVQTDPPALPPAVYREFSCFSLRAALWGAA